MASDLGGRRHDGSGAGSQFQKRLDFDSGSTAVFELVPTPAPIQPMHLIRNGA